MSLTDKEKFLAIGYIPLEHKHQIKKGEPRDFDVNEFREEFFRRLDVPEKDVAVLLSGGLDSSLVAWGLKAVGKNVHAFTIGYDDSPGEVESAEWVADTLDIPLTTYITSAQELLGLFPRWVKAMPKIHSEWSGLPQSQLLMSVPEKYKYVFTGDGGDDIFGGYIYFKALTELESLLDPAIQTPTLRAKRLYSILRDLTHNSELENLLIPLMEQYFNGSLVQGLSDFTVDNWLGEGMIPKGETAEKLAGKKIKAPFIEMLEYAQTLPDEVRVDKKALRELLKTTPLAPMADKKKLGFKPPFVDWFQKEPWSDMLPGSGNFREDLINFRKLVWREKN